MKNLSPKFYLSLGLTSLLLSIVLLAMLGGLIPDRTALKQQSRSVFAESLASSSSLFLQNNDFKSIRFNLDFAVSRHGELHAASVKRHSDGSEVIIGEIPAQDRDNVKASRMTVPVLTQSGAEWGEVTLDFAPLAGTGWLEKLQRSRLFLFAFLLLAAFVSFYLYLGKMLNQLNPTAAVPARVRSALDTIAESLVVINRKGDIVLANSAFSALVRRPPEDLIGTSLVSFDWSPGGGSDSGRDSDDHVLSHPWESALQNNLASRNDMLWYQDSEGKRHKFIVNCSPVAGTSGKAGGVLISLDDVTLLEQKEQELMRSREEAIAANHAKSDFLSNMSHEIRTPMTAILGFTEVLRRGYNHDESSAQKYLDTISRSGKHLLGLINDILDLSKVESGALEVESIDCAAHSVIHDVIQVLGVKAEEKSVYLRQEFPEALPAIIKSDPARLRQIVTNLVGNAIKFTERGGVSVQCRLIESRGRQQLSIDIADTGIGMTDEQAGSIFDAFVQADATITRRFGGTGLGLSISRDLAQAMGGDIVANSVAGEGSVFSVTIDTGDLDGVARLSPTELMEVSRKLDDQQHSTVHFSGATVLVVDDAEENRELLCLVLGELGIEVETGENGQQALDMALAGDYDLVLMDIQMPVMDGFQAAGLMRSCGLELPIVALTANAMKGFEDEITQSGFSHYMTKPIDMDMLAQMLATLLQHRLVSAGASVGSEPVSPAQPDSVDKDRIVSFLAQKNPQFRQIAANFLVRLEERMDEIDTAVSAGDMKELGALAHWLKGSGGSVGFDVFNEPAKALELATKNNDAVEVPRQVALIRSLLSRCDASGTESNNDSVTNQRNRTKTTSVDQASAASVLGSSLALDNPVMRDIVARFIPKLKEKVSTMHEWLDKGQYEQLAADAHWLKGTAGNVGFNEFTLPAGQLEMAAKSSDESSARRLLADVARLAEQVKPPADDGPEHSAATIKRSA